MATATTKTGRAPLTAEQRAEQIAVLTEQLNTAVGQLTTTDAWLSMLRTSARFHRYSFRNMILL